MLHRRHFIAASAGALAFPASALLPTGARAAEFAAPAMLVIHDPDHQAAAWFARHAAAAGARVFEAAGDRYRLLRGLLQDTRPSLIVGIGTRTDQILLAGTAAEHGYRQQGEALHRGRAHACSGTLALHQAALTQAGAAWPAWLASALTGHPLIRAATTPEECDQALVSWVAIPRRKLRAA
jgi:hypothetical protein